MQKKIKYLLLGLIFLPVFVFAQNIDSLKNELKNAKHDTTRCNILISMIEAENDDNIWPKYNNDLLKLVESKLKLSNLTKSEKYFYQKNLAEAINNIGFLAKQKGDISNAINLYNKSLLVYEEILDKKGVANSLINIGAIYFNQDEIQKSLMYFEKSLRIQEEIGDKYGIATSLNNIATIYNDYGDPTENLKKDDSIKSGIVKALKYFEKSLKIFEELGDKSKIANSLNNIGCIYFKYGDPSITTSTDQSISIGINKALDYYNKSLIIHKEIGNKVGIAYSLNHIGGIYIKQKNYQKALEFCTKSMQVSKELNYPENIAYAAEKLKIIYSVLGKEKLALENYELYIQMRDSINNIETQKATIKQQTKYEFDKQQILEKEKHNAELLIQKEKADADKKKQYIIIFSVSIVLILVGVFSLLLYKRFKTTQLQKTIITEQKQEVENQKHLVEEKQKEILDSIHYAKRLQEAILPPLTFINDHLPNNFVLYQPKDVVAGDFYWAESRDDKFYIAAADCTGHGVPGAMVSVVCSNALYRTVNEFGITDTGKILDKTRELVLETFAKGNAEVKDGMDISLLCIDKQNNKAFWSGANNPLWYVQLSGTEVLEVHVITVTSSEVEKSTDAGLDFARPDTNVGSAIIVEIKADKQPIGKTDHAKPFTTHEIALQEGMLFYLFTDGYADQFGGPKGKKFKYKQLEELLLAHANRNMNEQHEMLTQQFTLWKGDLEQVDDVCVIGVKI